MNWDWLKESNLLRTLCRPSYVHLYGWLIEDWLIWYDWLSGVSRRSLSRPRTVHRSFAPSASSSSRTRWAFMSTRPEYIRYGFEIFSEKSFLFVILLLKAQEYYSSVRYTKILAHKTDNILHNLTVYNIDIT